MKKYRYVGLLLAVVMSVFVFSGTAFAVPDENTQWLMELIDRSVDPAEKAELETLPRGYSKRRSEMDRSTARE